MNPKQDQLETIIRIDESINGPDGLRKQIHNIESDVSSIKLIVVGGINPDGKDVPGIAQTFEHHVQDHKRATRRNLTIITILATAAASGIREILRLFHVG